MHVRGERAAGATRRRERGTTLSLKRRLMVEEPVSPAEAPAPAAGVARR